MYIKLMRRKKEKIQNLSPQSDRAIFSAIMEQSVQKTGRYDMQLEYVSGFHLIYCLCVNSTHPVRCCGPPRICCRRGSPWCEFIGQCDQSIPPVTRQQKITNNCTWCRACPCSPRTPGARPHTARSAWAAASPATEGHYVRWRLVARTSKQMGHSNSDFQKAASISYCACSLSPLFSLSSIFFSSSLSLLREQTWGQKQNN